jgi:hypothetical protein
MSNETRLIDFSEWKNNDDGIYKWILAELQRVPVSELTDMVGRRLFD